MKLDERLFGWEYLEMNGSEELTKSFEFSNFKEGLSFVNHIGRIAEEEGHHPDISLSYDEVTVSWSTHSENKVTKLDEKMALATEKIAKGDIRISI